MKKKYVALNLLRKSLLFFTFILLSAFTTGQVHKSGYLSLGEDSLYFETAGTGRTMLFIHDGLLNGDVWEAQFKYFSDAYRVIRYDRRGYGRSSTATESYTHLADLKALLGHLDIEKATLLAISSGGALAIDYTLDYPDQVEALVLVGAVVGGFSYTRHMRNRGGHLPDNFKNEKEEARYYAMEDPFEIYVGNSKAREGALAIINKYPPKNNRRQTYIKREKPSLKRLHEIQIPSLILTGEFDIPDVHAHAGAINAGIPDSRREVISQSGHLIPLEQSQNFNEVVEQFLKSLPLE
jgi:pimeloyl-ACP methyl ester carboxylesterase